MDIQQLYKAIAEALGLVADAEGLLSFNAGDELTPAMVGGERLALPTAERLRSGNWHGVIAFHPFSEHVLRGESPVLKKIRMGVNYRLATVLRSLLIQFVELGADSARHARLSPKASELLSAVKDVDEKSVAAMEKIIEATQEGGPQKVISIYLKRGGTLRDQKYSRVAVVSVPFLEAFQEGDGTHVYGVKVRRKDHAAFQSLVEYILPGAEDLESYSAGSKSADAPYFDALMHAFYNVSKRLNEVVKIHKKQLSDAEDLVTDLSWIEAFTDLSVYRDVIPPLTGNTGEVGIEDSHGVEIKAAPAVKAIQPAVQSIKPAAPAVAAPVKIGAPEAPVKSAFNTNIRAADIVPPVAVVQEGSLFHKPDTNVIEAKAGHGGKVHEDKFHIKHTAHGVDFASLMEARQRAAQHTPVGGVQPGFPGAPVGYPTQPAGAYYGQPVAMAGGFGQPPQQMWGAAPLPTWAQGGGGMNMGWGGQPQWGAPPARAGW